jgi:protein TonB
VYLCVWETLGKMKIGVFMTTMTFESVYASPRRAAARRNRPLPRVVADGNPSAAIATIRNVSDSKRSRNRIAFIVVIGIMVALHAVIIAVFDRPFVLAPLPAKAPPMTLEIAPPPPPPVIQPKPLPQVAAKPVAHQPPPSVPVVQSVAETTEPSADTVQVAVAPPPAPVVATPAPEPITEARGYAGYLNNPAPIYPPEAQKRGLQGRVTLKVHVLANGQVDNVSIFKSTGYDILDAAAIKAVSAWVFEPAKRGQTPVDGFVNVPINFKHS